MSKLTKSEIVLLTEFITNPKEMERMFQDPYNLDKVDKKILKIFKNKPNEVKKIDKTNL